MSCAEKRMADEHAKLGLHGGRPKKRSDDTRVFQPAKLSELGLSYDESSRLQPTVDNQGQY